MSYTATICMEWEPASVALFSEGPEIRCHVFAIDNTLRVSMHFAEQPVKQARRCAAPKAIGAADSSARYGVASAASIVRTVSRPLARAASTVPMSRPW